eukprot:scaffold2930_cov376-Prasinococcus_capsulatus_cf.AAC.9
MPACRLGLASRLGGRRPWARARRHPRRRAQARAPSSAVRSRRKEPGSQLVLLEAASCANVLAAESGEDATCTYLLAGYGAPWHSEASPAPHQGAPPEPSARTRLAPRAALSAHGLHRRSAIMATGWSTPLEGAPGGHALLLAAALLLLLVVVLPCAVCAVLVASPGLYLRLLQHISPFRHKSDGTKVAVVPCVHFPWGNVHAIRSDFQSYRWVRPGRGTHPRRPHDLTRGGKPSADARVHMHPSACTQNGGAGDDAAEQSGVRLVPLLPALPARGGPQARQACMYAHPLGRMPGPACCWGACPRRCCCCCC